MILQWSRAEFLEMPEEILTELAALTNRHPWWRARARLALALLAKMQVQPPASVLDAGCGWGLTLTALEARGYRAAGLDVSRGALERLDQPGRRLIVADLTQPLPADAETYDAVLALDVIEHIPDDRAAVANLARLVRPGGLVMISVPALPDLYSEFDSIQGHQRRYLPETLQRAFDNTGLAVDRILWWGSWMVPVLRRQRSAVRGAQGESPAETYRRYLRLPPGASWLLAPAYFWEHRRTLDGKSQVGTSLFALARRTV